MHPSDRDDAYECRHAEDESLPRAVMPHTPRIPRSLSFPRPPPRPSRDRQPPASQKTDRASPCRTLARPPLPLPLNNSIDLSQVTVAVENTLSVCQGVGRSCAR